MCIFWFVSQSSIGTLVRNDGALSKDILLCQKSAHSSTLVIRRETTRKTLGYPGDGNWKKARQSSNPPNGFVGESVQLLMRDRKIHDSTHLSTSNASNAKSAWHDERVGRRQHGYEGHSMNHGTVRYLLEIQHFRSRKKQVHLRGSILSFVYLLESRTALDRVQGFPRVVKASTLRALIAC